MKKMIVSFLLLTVVAVFSACEKVVGDGPVVQQLIPVTGFSKISVAIHGRVNFSVGPVYKVEVLAQQNVINVMRFDKDGDELTIKFQNGVWVKSDEDIVVNITAPAARAVDVSGSASFRLITPLTADNLSLNVSGSGSIEVQQASVANEINATVSGSGSIAALAGSSNNEHLRVSGSGSINLAGLQTNTATTEVSGSGKIKLKVSQFLEAHISGSGSVYYLGNPVITSHISGSGGVRPL